MHDLLQLEKRHQPVWLVLDTAGVQVAERSRDEISQTDKTTHPDIFCRRQIRDRLKKD
jgi:hypothetical protein